MPELAEVETIRSGVAPYLLGNRILEVTLRHPRATRALGGIGELVTGLSGRRVSEVARRGKYMWWTLDDASCVVVHLGMSGQFRVETPGDEAVSDSHTRVVIGLENGCKLRFQDQRTFGHLTPDALVPTQDAAPGGWGSWVPLVPVSVGHIGRDPLDPVFDLVRVAETIATSNRGIKRLLMDQTLLSGIGNIYADEALWRAQVFYGTPGRALDAEKIRSLLAASTEVLSEALSQGGTSFDALYVHVNGESGYFDRSLNAYGREGKPCRRCGTVMERGTDAGRSCYFCPRCQGRG